MKNENRDNLWMAHMDGELDLSESVAFEESLSPREIKRLQAEKRLEQRLGETLLDGRECPDALWQETKRAMLENKVKKRRTWQWAGTLAAAAVVLVVAGTAWLTGAPQSDPFAMEGGTVASLAAESDTAATAEAVMAYASERGFDIALPNFPTTPEGSHHHVELLGAKHMRLAGEDAMAIHFACCGEPARVVMTHTGGKAARALRDADWAGKVQDFQLFGRYEAGVVSDHQTDNLSTLLHSAA
jgi:hypothetical protein